MKDKSFTMSLCPICRADFQNADKYYIRRVDPNQMYKEKCTYCNVRDGYDYDVISKEQKEKR